jgi:hypothetical protein
VAMATECSEEMQVQSSKLNSIVWNAVAGCLLWCVGYIAWMGYSGGGLCCAAQSTRKS